MSAEIKDPRSPVVDDYRARYLKLRSVLHDRATGLPAVPMLLDELRAWLDDHKKVGVIHLAVEQVALVESLYGWQVLDRIRGRVAEVVDDCVGRELPEGTRWALEAVAGTEFVAFVPPQPSGEEVDAAFLESAGTAVARRLEEAFDEERFAGLSPRLGVRAGHALLSINPFYRFERRVWAALGQARGWQEERSKKRERGWSADLRKIIKDESLRTWFQPVVELETREVLGFEALVRGPEDSVFEMPRTMFALSERFGASAALDRKCCEAALRASAGLAGRGKIFLNLLPGDKREQHWREGPLIDELQALALEPADVVLEFSERAAGPDSERFVAALEHVKDCGFGVALDDMGTGYGSQALLERVQPDFLKLDVSLVHEVHRNLIKQELLVSLVRLAERIDAAVIAEGVESDDELQVLLEAGARYGQGFLFAAPAPLDAAAASGAEAQH